MNLCVICFKWRKLNVSLTWRLSSRHILVSYASFLFRPGKHIILSSSYQLVSIYYKETYKTVSTISEATSITFYFFLLCNLSHFFLFIIFISRSHERFIKTSKSTRYVITVVSVTTNYRIFTGWYVYVCTL